jgi:hypothetical protein
VAACSPACQAGRQTAPVRSTPARCSLTLSLTRSLTHLNSACCLPVPLLQGIKVGEFWKDRLDCRQWGAHFPHVAGIAGQSNVGAQSVVLSGG